MEPIKNILSSDKLYTSSQLNKLHSLSAFLSKKYHSNITVKKINEKSLTIEVDSTSLANHIKLTMSYLIEDINSEFQLEIQKISFQFK